jgi:hypothetical protein
MVGHTGYLIFSRYMEKPEALPGPVLLDETEAVDDDPDEGLGEDGGCEDARGS